MTFEIISIDANFLLAVALVIVSVLFRNKINGLKETVCEWRRTELEESKSWWESASRMREEIKSINAKIETVKMRH